MARMFGKRPSEIIDPDNLFGKLFAFEFDAFCALIAMEMVSDGRLV
ncbi:MAG: hypothetical protein KatS3mg003_0986 [Candidatus Nitrosocaldaceae archaeon]|nr:MAG: hypothetical protein KatS3mg003_0986 [Candidatus Nitrosocaldaceae archaeon]